MPELAAVTEAPEIVSPEITESPETHGAQTEDIGAESDVSTTESTEDHGAQVDPKNDGRSFAGKLRDLHKQLMASQDPNDQGAAKQLKELFFTNKAFKEQFPGGLQEVIALKESYEKFGTPEQIEQYKADVQTLEDIDTKWQAADPRFIDELAELNADSFKKLMPVGLNKFAQVDPDGYQRVMSGILSSTLAQAKMGDQLYLISRELQRGDTAEALSLIKQIQNWMGDLDKVAKAPAQEAPKGNPELEQKQAEFEQKQTEFFNKQLTTEVTGWRDAQIKTVLNKLTNGKQVDPERMEIFQDRVVRELVKMHAPDFQDKWTRLYAQGDKDALVKFVQGIDGANISKAVTKVYALLFPPNGVRKAPVTTPAQQPTPKPAEAGWIKIPQRPRPDQIARGRNETTDDMIYQGKAILRDGRKVQWDRA